MRPYMFVDPTGSAVPSAIRARPTTVDAAKEEREVWGQVIACPPGDNLPRVGRLAIDEVRC